MTRAFWQRETPEARDRRRRQAFLLRQALEKQPRPRRPVWPFLFAVLTFLVGLLIGAKAYGADPVVTLTARPTIMLQRGDIRLEAHVTPDAANRALAIAWTSDSAGEGRSLRALEGAEAPVIHELELRDQLPANYLFEATVFDAAGKRRGSARAEVHRAGGDR